MTNIIDAQDRFSGNLRAGEAREKRPALSDRLRDLSKVHLNDRALMATRMGELAARLNPDKPLDGARQIFSKASWDRSKWDKRKRLVRLPDEDQSDPWAYGSYESSGKTWATLIAAAAELITKSADRETKARECERIFGDVLRGTSLQPNDLCIPTGVEGTRELIDMLAQQITKAIGQKSRIKQLWNILRTSPFHTRFVDEPASTKLEEAALLAHAHLIEPERQQLYRGKLSFSTEAAERSTQEANWSFPKIPLGALAQRVERDVFVLPADIEDAFLEPDDGGGEGFGPNEARIRKWLRSIGAEETADKWNSFRLPSREYDETVGYGWKSIDAERTRSVMLEVRPKDTEHLGAYIWIEDDEDQLDDLIPIGSGIDLAAESVCRRSYWKNDFCGIATPMLTEHAFDWPEWISKTGLRRKDSRQFIGLADSFAGEWTPQRIGGWLDDADNLELWSILLGGQENVRFVPKIACRRDTPLPCRSNSIAAALIGNASMTEERRLDFLMSEHANNIAEAGLGFHQAVLDHHREIIMGLGDAS